MATATKERVVQKYYPEHRERRFKNETEFGRWLSATTHYKIVFKDNGQDCLAWYIDAGGEVLHAEPFQASVWCGMCVDMAALKVGKEISVVKNQRSKTKTTYDFVVEKIEKTKGK